MRRPIDAFMRLLLAWLSGQDRLLIMTYHRVLEERDPLLAEEPSVQEFRRHAEYIAKYLNALPLREAAERLRSRTLPPRAACITFDDGYRNNYELAAPILEEHSLPATFFIATGAVESGGMFNDAVIEAVRRAPELLDLDRFGLGAWDCSTPEARSLTLTRLLDEVKYLPSVERQEKTTDIFEAVAPGERLDLMMTRDMIRDLAARGFEIGGHTVSHPILANLDERQARAEIGEGRDWLTEVLGAPPRTFAYPNGRPGIDFRPEHAQMVKDLGFECAVSTEWSVATLRHDAYALPRLTPWDQSELRWSTRVARSYARATLAG